MAPYPHVHWMNHNLGQPNGMLVFGNRFRVIKAFADYDDPHSAGETWFYLGCNFVPYDGDLSLFMSLDGDREWHIHLQWRAENQAPIIENPRDYVVDISSGHREFAGDSIQLPRLVTPGTISA